MRGASGHSQRKELGGNGDLNFLCKGRREKERTKKRTEIKKEGQRKRRKMEKWKRKTQ